MNCNDTLPPAKKAKRTRLTLAQKAEAVHKLQSGPPFSVIMRKFSIGRRTVTKLRSEAPQILQCVENQSSSLHSKSSRPAQFPIIEERLNEFFIMARALKMPITAAVLQQRALVICESLVKSAADDSDREKLRSFVASQGWVSNFVKRWALRSVSLSGEGGSVNGAQVSGYIAALREKLREFDPSCIFNVDETGLFFKLLPRRTYISSFEDKRSVRGTKAMPAKDQITAYIATNSNGVRVPLSIIGTAKKTRCFRIETPPVKYFHHKTHVLMQSHSEMVS